MLIFGCMRRLVMLALLVALGAAGWYFRHDLMTLGRRVAGEGSRIETPSPALAGAAEAKLQALAADGARVALSEAEVQSLVTYRLSGMLPPFVFDPRVALDGDRLRLSARVETAQVPDLGQLGEVADFLPDTTDVAASGQLIPIDSAHVAIAIDELSAARIPLPSRVIPRVLARLGRRARVGVPPEALVVPLPAGATTAYVRNDSLVLLGRPAAR